MKRTIARIRRYGPSLYLERKLYALSPGLHQLLYRRGASGFRRTAYGVEMAENWSDATFRMCVFGGQGAALAETIGALREPFLFLDIGANQGLYSLIAARNPACTGVLAFEPVPDTYALLGRNVRHAAESAKIRILNAGVADRSGTAAIGVAAGHSGAASLSPAVAADKETQVITLMSATEIDPLIPPAAAIFVKIDVEGYEPVVVPEVLRLAAADRISHIFFEADSRWIDVDALIDRLRDAGFTRFDRFGRTRHFDVLAQRA